MLTLLSISGLLGLITAFVVFSVRQIEEWQRFFSKYGDMESALSRPNCAYLRMERSPGDYGRGLDQNRGIGAAVS